MSSAQIELQQDYTALHHLPKWAANFKTASVYAVHRNRQVMALVALSCNHGSSSVLQQLQRRAAEDCVCCNQHPRALFPLYALIYPLDGKPVRCSCNRTATAQHCNSCVSNSKRDFAHTCCTQQPMAIIIFLLYAGVYASDGQLLDGAATGQQQPSTEAAADVGS